MTMRRNGWRATAGGLGGGVTALGAALSLAGIAAGSAMSITAAVPVASAASGLPASAFAVDGVRRFAPPFATGVVLQRNDMAPIRGFASPGDRVQLTASWRDAALEGITDDDGRWLVRVPTPEAGGPHVIEVRISDAGGANAEVLRLADVYVGEVWVAGGQSNMEMRVAPQSVTGAGLGGVRGWPDMLERPADPMLRLYDVPRAMADRPIDGPPPWDATWVSASPETVGRMSAVAYEFGVQLRRELDVPVGIITSNWGGTRIEPWMSAEALEAHGGSMMDALAGVRERAMAAGDEATAAAAADVASSADPRSPMDAADPGISGNWAAASFDDQDWDALEVPGNWAAAPLDAHDGLVWIRRAFDVPADHPGLASTWTLTLGAIDDRDETWINGILVGRTGGNNRWNERRRYTVPAGVVQAGRNVIAVRVRDMSGPGGMTGPAEVMRLTAVLPDEVDADADATTEPAPIIELAGSWRARATLTEADIRAAGGPAEVQRPARQNDPTVLSNAMIDPLTPTAVRGFIWYQGESNVGNAAEYATLQPAMIEDWRRRFGRPQAAFHFVQIAPFNYGARADRAAWLRDAQRRSLAHPGTGMVVTSDIGTPWDIHPMDKTTVAERLAGLALRDVYGRDGDVATSPLYEGFQRDGEVIRVRFAAVGGALATIGQGPLTHFEILDPDGAWRPATAKITGELTVEVRSDGVTDPQAVRFGWGSLQAPNLVGPTGLPASPFTTEALR